MYLENANGPKKTKFDFMWLNDTMVRFPLVCIISSVAAVNKHLLCCQDLSFPPALFQESVVVLQKFGS